MRCSLCGSSNAREITLGILATGTTTFFIFIIMLTTKNQNVTSVQAQKMCKEFIKVIRKNYKKSGIHSFHFKKIGTHYHFRARWRKRSLWGFHSNAEMAMAKFMLEISSKVFQEHYYPQEEFAKIKHLLQERLVLQYSIKELPN